MFHYKADHLVRDALPALPTPSAPTAVAGPAPARAGSSVLACRDRSASGSRTRVVSGARASRIPEIVAAVHGALRRGAGMVWVTRSDGSAESSEILRVAPDRRGDVCVATFAAAPASWTTGCDAVGAPFDRQNGFHSFAGPLQAGRLLLVRLPALAPEGVRTAGAAALRRLVADAAGLGDGSALRGPRDGHVLVLDDAGAYVSRTEAERMASALGWPVLLGTDPIDAGRLAGVADFGGGVGCWPGNPTTARVPGPSYGSCIS